MGRALRVLGALALWMVIGLRPAAAEISASDYQKNLTACRANSSYCLRSLLLPTDLAVIEQADYVRNLTACRAGYASCDSRRLTSADLASVQAAAYQRNLNACRAGYASCDRNRIADADRASVEQAAYQRNLNACRYGSSSCDRAALAVNAAAANANPNPAPGFAPDRVTTGCAENGSCYGDISAVTGNPKTVPVRGYYRKDGTYVRGHYRSRR